MSETVPELSVIIPVYRESLAILRLLHHLRSCAEIHRCEFIVVDGDSGSTITPTDIVPSRVLQSPPGRGMQLNRGAAAARADALLFLHVDTELPKRFVQLVLTTLAGVGAGAFDLSIRSAHPLVRLISFVGMLRSRITRIPYGDQAHFIRRSLFDRIGGFPESPLMEDVALMDKLLELHEPITILSAPARTSDRRWREEGALAGTLRNWRLMLAYRAGKEVTSLVRRYKPQSRLESDEARIIVFYRAFREEGVKTRLAASVGKPTAAAIYRACVTDLSHTIGSAGLRSHWFVDDPAAGASVDEESIPQHGSNLFERMADAFRRVFSAGTSRAILIGSDVPGLSRTVLLKAAASLTVADAVIGPTLDGGYYLIGFRSETFCPELVDLSQPTGEASAGQQAPSLSAASDEVAAATVARIRSAGLRVASVETLRDLDTVEDLAALVSDSELRAPELRKAVARRNVDLSLY